MAPFSGVDAGKLLDDVKEMVKRDRVSRQGLGENSLRVANWLRLR